MDFVWVILFGVAAFSAVLLVWILWEKYLYKRRLAKFDNYDRVLSSRDHGYLAQAESDLEAAAKVKTPKRYGVFLHTALIPMILIFLGVIWGCLFGFQTLVNQENSMPDGVIYREGGEFSLAFAAANFCAIFLAAAALYAISMRSPRLSNYVALNSDIYGNRYSTARQGLLENLEHQIRSRAVSTAANFSADAFLKGRNQSYRDGCMKAFYGCMIVVLFIGFLDLRSVATFYSDRIESSGDYFSFGQKRSVDYRDITHVELACYFSDSQPRSYYDLFVGGDRLASISLRGETLEPLSTVNDILREQNQTSFRPRVTKKGKTRLFSNCVENLGTELGELESLRDILSV